MPVQSFNERSLADGNVPQTGSTSGASPSGPGVTAKGVPRAVEQADGTANIRADEQTLMAAPISVSGGKSSIPKAVDKYAEGTV